mmetsp:Transcript_8019/g.26271  ORF Transcript_8019/g.26271 Transcript_8019/m.26271 type:complete len:213 (+) Transcript_8019:1021-1659(+)
MVLFVVVQTRRPVVVQIRHFVSRGPGRLGARRREEDCEGARRVLSAFGDGQRGDRRATSGVLPHKLREHVGRRSRGSLAQSAAIGLRRGGHLDQLFNSLRDAPQTAALPSSPERPRVQRHHRAARRPVGVRRRAPEYVGEPCNFQVLEQLGFFVGGDECARFREQLCRVVAAPPRQRAHAESCAQAKSGVPPSKVDAVDGEGTLDALFDETA